MSFPRKTGWFQPCRNTQQAYSHVPTPFSSVCFPSWLVHSELAGPPALSCQLTSSHSKFQVLNLWSYCVSWTLVKLCPVFFSVSITGEGFVFIFNFIALCIHVHVYTCICACMCTHHVTYLEVRGQLVGVSFLSTICVLELRIGHQAQQHMLLQTIQYHWPVDKVLGLYTPQPLLYPHKSVVFNHAASHVTRVSCFNRAIHAVYDIWHVASLRVPCISHWASTSLQRPLNSLDRWN